MSSAGVAEYDLSEILKAYRMKWEGHKTAEKQYRPPSYKCPHCKDVGFVSLYPQNRAAHGEIDTVIYCPYCRTNMLKDISGIIAEYRDLDISKFPWGTYQKYNRNADVSGIRKVVESFVYDFQMWKDEGVGLYIYSKVKGSGKTMAANAICGSICAKYNIGARFTKVEDFLEDIKKPYGDKGRGEPSRAEIRKYYDTELLVLDDLCVSKVSEWGQDKLHDLINERYKAGKPCVITSNFTPEELPVNPATIDRINDMCMVLHFPEIPVRSQSAQVRKNRLLQKVASYDRFVDASGGTPFEGETK